MHRADHVVESETFLPPEHFLRIACRRDDFGFESAQHDKPSVELRGEGVHRPGIRFELPAQLLDGVAFLAFARVQKAVFAAGSVLAHAERLISEGDGRFENLSQRRRSVFAELAAMAAVQRNFPGLGRHGSSLRRSEAKCVRRPTGRHARL